MLSLARVLAKDDNSLTIRHLDRPNAHEAAFSFGITSGEGEGEEEVIQWDSVFALSESDAWRVVT
jgi:hypothetical protein